MCGQARVTCWGLGWGGRPMCRHCRYGLSLLVSARVEVKYTRPPPGLQAALVLMVRTSGEVLEEEEEG